MTSGVQGRARGVRLAGSGMAVPTRVVTNQDLAQVVQTTDEWIVQRTGIKQRHILDDGVTMRSLARSAIQTALADARLTAKDIDLLLCATLTPEMCTPSTAARLVAEMDAVPAGALDLSAACSGFVYGLNLGYSLIMQGACRTVALVGVEALSRVTDWKDRRTCVLFGDGAGAAILTASDDALKGCLYQSMHSNGNLWPELYCPRSEADLPPNAAFSGAYNTLQMNGREVYKFAVTTLLHSIEKVLSECGLRAEDLAMIIPHQSNARILESARDKLGVPHDKLYINIDRYGNTSAASVPICLHELRQAGRIKPGDLVLFIALGGGMTWATSLWRI